MEKNHTRKQLQIQGFDLGDDALTEIGPYMRWAPAICASFMAVGTVLASPWVLWALAATAIAGVFLPSHPFDYIYNYGVRHLTGTPRRHLRGKGCALSRPLEAAASGGRPCQ